MTSATFWKAAAAVCGRNLRHAMTSPGLLLPPLAAPLVFFAVWVGALSGLARIPGFDYPAGYAAFQLPWALFQGALWTGVYSGIAMARDFESGFVKRMLLAAGDRRAVLVGYWGSAAVRAVLTIAIVLGTGLAIGVPLPEQPVTSLGALSLLALVLACTSSTWATGVALRVRSYQATPLMEMPIAVLLLIGPAFIPLALMTGWIRVAATGNPLTYFLDAGRDLLAGSTGSIGLALVLGAALVTVFTTWSVWSLRQTLPR